MADTSLIDDEMPPITDVKEVLVTHVFNKVRTTTTYEYDFGEGWLHHLEMVEVSTHLNKEALPQIIKSVNACPPEDCGETYGHRKEK